MNEESLKNKMYKNLFKKISLPSTVLPPTPPLILSRLRLTSITSLLPPYHQLPQLPSHICYPPTFLFACLPFSLPFSLPASHLCYLPPSSLPASHLCYLPTFLFAFLPCSLPPYLPFCLPPMFVTSHPTFVTSPPPPSTA